MQAAASSSAEASEVSFYGGKIAAARYFFSWELRRCEPTHALLRSLDRTTLDMRDDFF